MASDPSELERDQSSLSDGWVEISPPGTRPVKDIASPHSKRLEASQVVQFHSEEKQGVVAEVTPTKPQLDLHAQYEKQQRENNTVMKLKESIRDYEDTLRAMEFELEQKRKNERDLRAQAKHAENKCKRTEKETNEFLQEVIRQQDNLEKEKQKLENLKKIHEQEIAKMKEEQERMQAERMHFEQQMKLKEKEREEALKRLEKQKKTLRWECDKCGHSNDENARFCSRCGVEHLAGVNTINSLKLVGKLNEKNFKPCEEGQQGWILRNQLPRSLKLNVKLERITPMKDMDVVVIQENENLEFVVEPEQEIFVLLNVKAPPIPGKYQSIWQLVFPDNRRVGPTLELLIIVDSVFGAKKEGKIKKVIQMLNTTEREKVVKALEVNKWNINAAANAFFEQN